jgi:agmatinase
MEEYPNNFGGIPDEFAAKATAKIVLVPVPYDGTSTWGKGADRGPEAFLDAARNMELYDIETDTEVYRQGIYLAPPVTENSSPEAMVNAVHNTVKGYIDEGKFVTAFGGEHSISIGVIRAFMEKYEKLTVLQIDAHADLRESYNGSTCNHACAMHEASENTNLVQVGIRSMDISEKAVMRRENVFYAHEMEKNLMWMDEAIERMTRDVFITFDLDAFDPSVLPGTGTPEPGGMLWYDTLKFFRKVNKKRNIVGFDIVELLPNPTDRSSDFAAAKLYYKMLSYIFKKRNKQND